MNAPYIKKKQGIQSEQLRNYSSYNLNLANQVLIFQYIQYLILHVYYL